MATLWRSYRSSTVARDAVEELKAAGVPGRDIRLLAGAHLHDVRDEPVGKFAGRVEPTDLVGSFGNVRRLRCQAAGGFAGLPDNQRQGSFADSDREVIVSYDHGGERSRVSGDLEIRRLMEEAAIDDDALDRALDDLHAGSVVVLAEVAPIGPGDVRGRLEGVAASAA